MGEYLMPYLIAMLISALLSSTGVWFVQDWRHGIKLAELKKEIAEDAKEQIEQAAEDNIKAIEDARTEERAFVATIQKAEKEAREREQKSRLAAAESKRTADSLRDNLDALKAGMPFLTERAVRERAATLSGLLGDCAAEYSSMAETAQRHASDVKTLTDAWPKPPN